MPHDRQTTDCLPVPDRLPVCHGALAQAQEAADKSVSSTFNGRELVVGDRAPDLYQREVSAIHDWKKKGLKAPQEQSQWVQIKDQYVLVEITSGKILDMAPVKR
ncbi:RcnB family protein [Pseudomonas sp. QD4]|uniref:RcnB family protein n=1 Tax=Pseudomonas sp. QD4 TaxID=3368618 RepID=UPI003B9FF587